MNWKAFCATLALVSGCAVLPQERPAPQSADVAEETPVETAAPAPQTEARLVAAQNTQAPEPAATLKTGQLGQTVATLGDARQTGLWLKTPLVQRAQPGRIVYGGQGLDVELLPLEGPETGGSRISLQAIQALRAPLTGFLELSVTAL